MYEHGHLQEHWVAGSWTRYNGSDHTREQQQTPLTAIPRVCMLSLCIVCWTLFLLCMCITSKATACASLPNRGNWHWLLLSPLQTVSYGPSITVLKINMLSLQAVKHRAYIQEPVQSPASGSDGSCVSDKRAQNMSYTKQHAHAPPRQCQQHQQLL